jgi:hypothetical protein
MPTTMQIFADLVGSQSVTWAGFPVGTTVRYNFTCYDPADQSVVLNLTALGVFFTIKAIDTRGLPHGPAIISRACTIVIAADGTCYAPLSSGDTVPSGNPIKAGYYALDVWAEDVSGNRLSLGYGQVFISPASRLPDALVTALPEQAPLAQGEVFPYTTAERDALNDTTGRLIYNTDVDALEFSTAEDAWVPSMADAVGTYPTLGTPVAGRMSDVDKDKSDRQREVPAVDSDGFGYDKYRLTQNAYRRSVGASAQTVNLTYRSQMLSHAAVGIMLTVSAKTVGAAEAKTFFYALGARHGGGNWTVYGQTNLATTGDAALATLAITFANASSNDPDSGDPTTSVQVSINGVAGKTIDYGITWTPSFTSEAIAP